MKKILIVDDQKDITDILKEYLEFSGFEANTLNKSTEVLPHLEQNNYDLLILDIMMPFVNGIDIAKKVNSTPIIFLTAKDTLDDKIKGFVTGVDDYITKPFELAEVVARVRAVLRRTQHSALKDDVPSNLLTAHNIKINTNTNDIFVNDKELKVTPAEFKILKTLVENKGYIVSKLELLDVIKGNDLSDDVQIIETYIFNLRKKLEKLSASGLIETKRGAGYLIRDI